MNTVITGANRGLGLAFASRYAAVCAAVFALARDLNTADELHALAAASAGRVRPVALDLSDPQAVAGLDATLGLMPFTCSSTTPACLGDMSAAK